MGLLDYVAAPRQRVAYLFPEIIEDPARGGRITNQFSGTGGAKKDVFVFQFWPQQLQDNYTPNYVSKNIPGASHPLYQWTSGNGRDISFTATFVTELNENAGLDAFKESDFRSRIANQAASNASFVAAGASNAVGALLLPSARYTVNVAAALAALQRYLYPTYLQEGVVVPPKKLVLVLPGTKLGRDEGDSVLCILRSAGVTHEAYFPSGEIRAATVALRFSEIIQHTTGEDSNIKYIGAEKYDQLAGAYTTELVAGSEPYLA